MSESLFDGAVPTAPIVPDPVKPVVPTELAEFIGEGKKYSSVEEAAKSMPHAQKHILTLEQEIATMRDELGKRKTTQELLDEIKSGIPTGETTPQAEFNQDIVAQLVTAQLQKHENDKAAKINTSLVVEAFKAKYAEKAEEVYDRLAESSGLPVSVLNQLAATSPKAVLKLAGFIESPSGTPEKLQSSFNTESLHGKPNELPSARVIGRGTKDVVDAWKRAGAKVNQPG